MSRRSASLIARKLEPSSSRRRWTVRGERCRLVGDFVQAERGGQGGAQQVADANHHFAVAPVEGGDLARGAVEKG
jgi:hypothetical protein